MDLSWLGGDGENRAADEDFEDDNICLDHFHRIRTLRKLQEAYNRMDPEEFFDVFENFDSVKNSGYTIEEIFSTRTDKLIDRGEYIRTHERGDDDEVEGSGDIGINHETEEGASDSDDDSDEGLVEEESDDEDDEFEVVPEHMTQAVIQEEDEVRRALEESMQLLRDTEEEDEANGHVGQL